MGAARDAMNRTMRSVCLFVMLLYMAMVPLAALALTPTVTVTPIRIAPCAGDCDGDGRVGISELVRGVGAALGASDDDQCLLAFDREGTGTITVDELIAAVNRALAGCDMTPVDPGLLACSNSGGVDATEFCCEGVRDFRNTCTTGTCGTCEADARHAVSICRCGVERCFDGLRCARESTRTPTPTLDPSLPTPTPIQDDSVLPCLRSGGTGSTGRCCLGAAPFPNTCRIGPCSCPREVSRLISVCDCGPGRCYDSQVPGCVDVESAGP